MIERSFKPNLADSATYGPRTLHVSLPQRWKLIALICSITIAVAGASVWLIVAHPWVQTSSLPSGITHTAAFPLYYPAPVPDGFAYAAGSAKLDRNLLLFKMRRGSTVLTVTEQPAPTNAPNFSQLSGFQSVPVQAGKAVIGSSLGEPIALFLSNTTLVTASSPNNTPSDVLVGFVKNLHSLP
jgi:hypothetical protein